MVVAITIILVKNYFIEYSITSKLLEKKVVVSNIVCNGLHKTTCRINNISMTHEYNNALYDMRISSIKLSDILDIYSAYSKGVSSNSSFVISIKDLSIKDNKGIFNEISNNANLDFSISSNTFNASLLRKDLKVHIHSGRELALSTQNSVIHNIFYELYKFAFYQMKMIDGDDIAKGLNISLGYPSIDFIPKTDFINNSMPRAIELFISEIESYDTFIQHNKDMQLSNILNFLLKEEGEKKFNLDLPNIIDN